MKAIIVGGGVAGLFIALRLLDRGYDVDLFDTRLLGNGSSSKNHGMVHSGGLYAELHPHLVRMCIEAQALFKQYFSEARIINKPSIYFGSPRKIMALLELWETHGIEFSPAPMDLIREYFVSTHGRSFYLLPQESVYSSKNILEILAEEAVSLGGKIHTRTHIDSILVSSNKVSGVKSAEGIIYSADIVINASGIGMHKILVSCNSRLANRLKSRMDTMVVINNLGFDRVFAGIEYGDSVIAPTDDNHLIVSRFGGNQPLIQGDQRLPTWHYETEEALGKLRSNFHEKLFDAQYPMPYTCTKTEIISEKVDFAGVNPGHFLYDHGNEGIVGFYTYIAGKMTTIFHSSRDLLAMILKQKPENFSLELPPFQKIKHTLATGDVEVEPWKFSN